MSEKVETGTLVKLILLAWLATIAFDFFLHGGVLAFLGTVILQNFGPATAGS
ncbi:MAG: hypothetical protein ACE5G1_11535 [bacterium]